MNKDIMVKITTSNDYIAFTTYDRQHGHNGRFVMLMDVARRAFLGLESICDRDLNNYLSVSTYNGTTVLRFTWLREARYGCLEGFNQNIDIPSEILREVIITGEPVRFLYNPEFKSTQIHHESVAKVIKNIKSDKLKLSAFRKAMRDQFQWNNDKVTLWPDGGESFYFTTESGFPRNGGLILHNSEVRTRNGMKRAYRYEIHT